MKRAVQWGINTAPLCEQMNHAWDDGGQENTTTTFGDHILMDSGGKIVEASN